MRFLNASSHLPSVLVIFFPSVIYLKHRTNTVFGLDGLSYSSCIILVKLCELSFPKTRLNNQTEPYYFSFPHCRGGDLFCVVNSKKLGSLPVKP